MTCKYGVWAGIRPDDKNMVVTKKLLLIIFLVSLVLRVGLLIVYSGSYKAEQADALDYDGIASNILAGNGFSNNGEPTQTKPPVYPLFLAAVFGVFGHGDFPVKLLQCILSALTAVLITVACSKMFSAETAVTAGLISALYPPFIIYSNLKLSETLFTFLLITDCLMLIKSFETLKPKHFALAGILMGITTLCRATTIFFAVFLLPAVLFAKDRKKFLKGLALYFIISACVVSVWTIRNYAVFKTFLPVNVGSGHIMWLNLKDQWDGDQLIEPDIYEDYPDLKGMQRYEWEKIVTRRVAKYAVEHPVIYSSKLIKNIFRLWYLPVGKVLLAARSKLAASLYQTAHLLFVLISFYGIFISLKRLRLPAVFPALIFLIYLQVMQIPFVSIPRYRLPFEPFLIMFFSLAVSGLAGKYITGNLKS